MLTEDQMRQPCRVTKLQLPIEIVRLLSAHYPVHLAAYPEAEVPTQLKTQYKSRVPKTYHAQESYASRSLSRNPIATLEKITSQ
jgi:hypothetical protein